MIMKRCRFSLVVLILLWLLPNLTMAQNLEVRAGMGMSNICYYMNEDPCIEAMGSCVYGPKLGVMADFKISGNFSVELGPLLIPNGFRYRYPEDYFQEGCSVTMVFRYYNLHIPVCAKFSVYQKKSTLYAEMGPFARIFLAGNSKLIVNYDGQRAVEKEKITFGNADGEYYRFGYGAHVGGGVRFGSYSIGFLLSSTLLEGSLGDGALLATSLGISVGYRIGNLRRNNPMEI